MLRMATGVGPSRRTADAAGDGILRGRPSRRGLIRGLNDPGANVGWRGGLDENGAVGADGPNPELAALRSRSDLTGLPSLTRAVTEQVIGSTAELSYANNLVCSEPWLEAAVAALAAGASVVADGPVVVAG